VILHFCLTPRISHAISLCLVSRPTRYRLRERKMKLSPLLIETLLGGNALCIFGLGNASSYPARSVPCLLPCSRRCPPLSLSSSIRPLVDHVLLHRSPSFLFFTILDELLLLVPRHCAASMGLHIGP